MSPKEIRYTEFYLDVAKRTADLSYAQRDKVGCVIVDGTSIVSYGFNGMPAGMDNCCEDLIDGLLVTKPEQRHAERNALEKHHDCGGMTMYSTLSPCPACAQMIIDYGISKLVYADLYRITDGLALLDGKVDHMLWRRR